MTKPKRREPDSSKYHLEQVDPKNYVTSVREGAKIVWTTLVLCLLFIIILMLVIALITKPEWQPYVPQFLDWLNKAFEALAKLVG